jgi:hypothetical protein
MPTFLTDPSPAVFLLLAAAAFVSGAVWFNRRDRKSTIAFLTVAGLLVILLLLDRIFESPREESVRRVQLMARAADNGDAEGFAAQIADRFEYVGESTGSSITREQVRKGAFWNVLREHKVHVAVWDFSRDDVTEIDKDTVEIGFLGKGETGGKQIPMYFRATFSRQPDGQMRLIRFASFDPVKRTNERKTLPYFP